MPATTNPELLITPLAKNAEKNSIPETTGATTGLFSQDLGFQEINSTPLTAGGKAPDRKDFNGVFNLLGGVSFYAQKGWTFHYDATQDYYLGCLVIDPADGKRYECIADMTAGTIAPHSDTENTYWRRFTLGDGAHVGDIKAIAYNGTVQAGWLLCDGAAVSRTMYPDLFAAIGTTYGAGDGSTTFNLPDYNDAERFCQGSTTAGVVKAAGLPNITGALTGNYMQPATATWSGAFADGGNAGADLATGSSGWRNTLGFDASRSNSIYGASNTVQPPALTARFIIKAFDGQTADSALIDLTQYASDLANKATRGLDNLTSAGLEKIVDSVSKQQNGYLVLGNGLIVQWGGLNLCANPTNVSFPISFPNKIFSCVAVDQGSSCFVSAFDLTGGTSAKWWCRDLNNNLIAGNTFYIAIGY